MTTPDKQTVTNTRAAANGMADVAFGDAAKVWALIGFTSFGGAAGQIAAMHRLLVDERKWIDEPRFLHALSYCTLLPGPEAQQLATYIGWLMHGVRGGLYAGLMFVLPGALVMLGLSFIYAYGSQLPLVAGLFFGIKTSVLAIVAHAVLRIARRAFRGALPVAISVTAFALLFFLDAPFPLILLGAALLGLVVQPFPPKAFGATPVQDGAETSPQRWSETAQAAVLWGAVWWAPVAVAALLLGPGHILTTLGLFFGKLAMLSFGGAYALLAWLAQDAVSVKGWLSAAEMADGLGLAETTPGPTILVTQHVGFLAAWRAAAPFSPPVAAALGALMTSWVTFAPSFLWIFAGAPHMESLRANKRLGAALAAITAVVVGVMSYLAVWFGLHLLFADTGWSVWGALRWPQVSLASFDWKAALLSAVAFVLVMRLHWGLVRVVLVMAVLGVVARLAL
jgi:chromate transporter